MGGGGPWKQPRRPPWVDGRTDGGTSRQGDTTRTETLSRQEDVDGPEMHIPKGKVRGCQGTAVGTTGARVSGAVRPLCVRPAVGPCHFTSVQTHSQ